ncbi:N-acetylmuramoyl-L-alanine amidase [Melittangium boletus]|uniref:golvesin C-terminal-like domain-containing protein n=1 Tax=Melittangium boletus TaxID=83453 RepID=UPI003DA3F39D
MAPSRPFRALSWALSLWLCAPLAARAQVDEDSAHACGEEPPDAHYVPLPGPRAQEVPWRDGEPALVRREARSQPVGPLSGLPQTRTRAGALSGKTIYLSPGHGFYRSAPLGRWATQRPNTNGVVEDLVSLETLDQYLLPMLVGAGATVIPVREPDMNPRGVLLDNGAEGYTETGPAELFSTVRPGWGPPPTPMGNAVQPFLLGDARLLTAAPSVTASATWALRAPADGAYSVSIAYGADPGRVTDAHYVVRHAGGESHFRVNQRRHGGTWVLLGRFYFKAGAPVERASVVAYNDSAEAGTLSLDAVRLGGGTGDVGDAALGALPRPRAEESARYHTQFSGAPPEVFAPSGINALANERNDDVSARPRFAAWLHEEGEDAVYVAWHTNASANGTARGTEAYVYGPNPVDGTYQFTGVEGSQRLGQSLLDELKTDLQREVDPTWRVRNLRSANLGEVNPRHNPEIPSVLMEVAYHDNAQDAAWLKEPAFRRIAARAFLHGIIKYFAAEDQVAVHLPPEPPPAVVARHVGAGRVEVRWVAPPDPKGRVPVVDGATGYRVYQSEDGLGWDEGTDTGDPTWALALEPGTTRYFRVAAVNAGGESFPSDVVGVRVPEAGGTTRVLVVNAFRRLDAGMALTEDLSAYDLGSPVRLLLEAMNDGTALRRHGDAVARNAVAFDGATSEAVAAGLLTPVGYAVLDWFSGRGQAQGLAPTLAEQALMRAFVLGGGHLLLSGSQIASALAADPAGAPFLAEVLQALPSCAEPGPRVSGTGMGWLPGMGAALLDDGWRGGSAVGGTETLVPRSGATAALLYTGTQTVAGVRASPGGQVLFLGVPFEGLVTPERRAFLMGDVLHRAGLLSERPLPSLLDEALPADLALGMAASAAALTPCSLGSLPISYDPAETGCGCGAASGTVPFAGLLLLRLVQRRRMRHSARCQR